MQFYCQPPNDRFDKHNVTRKYFIRTFVTGNPVSNFSSDCSGLWSGVLALEDRGR
jgi:hypothetical protein